MMSKKPIPKEEAWFYTPEWQKKEREADEAIARGQVSGPFSSAEELIGHLDKGRDRAKALPTHKEYDKKDWVTKWP